ncbi:alpha/beta fold hydrolase [Microbulbifer sp. JSM ZJ756]|uniref:alpha/beta fold hydrolase n=1 Tax=Microbulbifer sp. JSM ZJ756 TaxID=3376191 RepID=UPI0037AB2542
MLHAVFRFSILASLFLGQLANAQVAGSADGNWQRSVVDLGRAKLEIFQQGSGRPVLMHPSLGRPAQDFMQVGESVAAAGYRVVLVNPRGIGGSTGPMDNVNLQVLARDLWAVADSLQLDRVFIVGQNFGNRVSRAASWLQPQRVTGLVLMAAGGEIEPDRAVWEEFQKVFDPDLPQEQHLQAVADSFFSPGNDPSLWKDGWHGETAQKQMEAARQTDFEPIYLGGTAPGLVIQGLDDRIAPPQNAWNLVQRRPDTRLVAYPNMGHAMLPEQPQALANALIDFLDSVAAPDQ